MTSSEMPEPFRCDVQPARDHVRVRPVGEVDVATVSLVERCLTELRAAGFGHIRVDLGEVEFMDSSGLPLLLAWKQDSVGARLAV
jgi:anti-anti-sigma factor